MGLKACSQVVVTIVLIHLLVEAAGGEGNIDSEKFDIKTKFHTQNGKCVRRITITGNGVVDSLAVHSCSDYGEKIRQENGAMVYGYWPKDSFYLFSDKPSTLVIVEDGECKMVEYTATDQHSSIMDNDECKAVQKKIADLTSGTYSAKTSESGVPSGSGHAENVHASVSKSWISPHISFKTWVQSWWIRWGNKKFNPSNFDVKTKSFDENGQCVRTVAIDGNGINKSFKVDCSSFVEKIIQEAGVLIYGHWPEDTFYLFSDTFGTLLVVQDGDCTKYTFTDTGTDSSVMGDAECSKLKKRIDKLSHGSTWFKRFFKRIGERIKFKLM